MGKIERLEVENFKSYGGQQVIGPFMDFTAVIGPNGAGKSNLMDAISFVLGIQSRHLRSTGLKDLIFKVPGEPPSRRRASVTLVYKVHRNEVPRRSAGEEIHFTRIISPTGAGSYRLNGKEVTWDVYEKQLRQIHILVKARNFLVFQGDVESIASKKPEELTHLFEQIAGSEALKDEYERLREEKNKAEEDTIFSFQKRKGLAAERKQVKEQKEEAERFKAKIKELGNLKREHFLWQLFHIVEDQKSREEDIQMLQDQMSELDRKETAIEERFQEKKKEHARKNRDALGIQKALNNLRRKLEDHEPLAIKIREQIKHCKSQIKSGSASYEKIKADMNNQKEEIDALQKDIEAILQVENELSSAAEDSSGTRLEESQLEEFRKLKDTARAQTAALRAELETVERQQTSDEERLTALVADEKELLANRERLDAEHTELQERKEKITAVVEVASKSIEESQKELQTLKEKESAMSEEKANLAKELDAVVQTLRSAKEDRRQGKHEQKMVEVFEMLKRLFPGVRGRLVDLCKPTQRRYNMAVTVAAGKHMDSIVVDDQKTARECIQYLREQRLGNAAFLPLASIRPKPLNERLRTLGPTVKLVFDVIDCEPDVRPAVLYAVANTVLCETLGDARELCFKRNEKVKAVTLSGAVISKSGAMTGGTTAADLARADRWDKKEVAASKRRRDDLQAQMSDLDRQLKSISSSKMQTLQTKISGLQNRLKYGKLDLEVTEKKLEGLEGQVETVEKRIKTLRPERQQLEAAVSSRKGSILQLQNKINKIEDKLYASFSKAVGISNIREYEEQAARAQEERAENRRKLHDQRAQLEAQLSYIQSRELSKPLAKLEKKLNADKKKLEKLQLEAEGLQESIQGQQQSIQEKEREFAAAEAEAKELEVELKTIQKEKGAVAREKNAVAKNVTTEEAKLERLKAKKHEVLQKARVEEVPLPLVGGGEALIGVGETSSATMPDGKSFESSESNSQMEEGSSLSQKGAGTMRVEDYDSVKIDFSKLKKYLDIETEAQYLEIHKTYLAQIAGLDAQIERMQPNMKALEKFEEVELRLRTTGEDLDRHKEAAAVANEKFEDLKQRRYDMFMRCFQHVANVIDKIYKDLTKSSKHPLGGTAYLSLENTEEPYSGGIKYNAMPPMKRFRDMEQLSGGEKTVAALALLFGIHSFHPSPFFVLDEVDAALDTVNVKKISSYIKMRSSDFQCIVISLKDIFYEKADSLVGVCRERSKDSSKTLTLDLKAFD